MMTLLGIPVQALFAQLLLGLINGSFYAILSLGLAIIFGLLNIINFAHGAQYMMGAFVAWILLNNLGIGYWPALVLAPLIVGLFGVVLERTLISRLYKLDHLYGLLLTFGVALVVQGLFRNHYGVSGLPYAIPSQLSGGQPLPFMFLPNYRAWVVVASLTVCVAVWLCIEKTKLGSYLRAATENATLVEAFGINVPLMLTLTYAAGTALAGFVGVLAAPVLSVNPNMGADIIIVVFAVVVIGGMGSLFGAIVTGLGLGLVEALTKVFYPEASTTVIFAIMVVVLLVKPAGLFGKETGTIAAPSEHLTTGGPRIEAKALHRAIIIGLAICIVIAPMFLYPVFLMKVLCFALLALAFNLLLGYGGLLSFGHAAYFGMSGYVTAFAAKAWNLSPELSILLGVVVAVCLGFVFGILAVRRQGIYFSMITLALAQMVFFFCVQAPFTGGEDGIQSVPRGKLFGIIDLSSDIAMYAFIATVFLGALIFIYRVIHSPFGQTLKSIRDNELRAISLGFRASQYKVATFVLSAGLAGLAGSMKVLALQLASLSDVHWSTSGDVVLMTLVGGMGMIFGPIVGAFTMVSMQNYLAQFGAWVTVIQGAIFIVCVLLFRQGVVGLIARKIRRQL